MAITLIEAWQLVEELSCGFPWLEADTGKGFVSPDFPPGVTAGD